MKKVEIQVPDWVDENEVRILVENIIEKKRRVDEKKFIDLLRKLPEHKNKEFKWKEIKKEYYEGKVRCR